MRIEESKFFIIVVIPFALAIMILTSAHAWSDGTVHFWNVYHLSNQVLGYEGDDEWKARGEDINLFNRAKDDTGVIVTEELFDDFHIYNDDDTSDYMVVRPDHMTYYSIVSYIPQVFGMVLGRLLGLSGIMTFILARLIVLAIYVIFCYRAIKRTPIAKSMFMVLSLMPFTLLIATSFSYDVMVYLVSINFLACVFKLRYEFRTSVLVEMFVYTFLLGAVKGGGYLILLPAVFMILSSESVNLNRKKIIIFVGLLVLTGIVSLLIFDIIIPAGQELFQFSKNESGEYAASYVLLHPIGYLIRVCATYASNTLDALRLFGGTPTGYMNIILMIMGPLYACFEKRRYELKKSDKWILISVIMLFLVFIPMMLLDSDPERSITIGGLRARYYLPMMPAVLLLVGRTRIVSILKLGKDTDKEREILRLKKVCMGLILFVNVFGVVRIM